MLYITPEEYAEITGRDKEEATNSRIKGSMMLLDARIGNYARGNDGYKLDMDKLDIFQKDVVKRWVAQMIAFLVDNNDSSPTSASITLGKFSVTEHGQTNQVLPESMGFVDAMLSSSGLIRRGVDVV